ncbi:MAG TPA: sugar transferase [Jiangellaceae bacterium]|jgi:lipopolysaccharide/colanic/teichoic acid biosynthesis glycosyltransferase|nr:sugar transferase [Jiangellaceae bacterium]
MTRSRRLYPAIKRLLDVIAALVMLGPTLVILAVAAVASLVIEGPPVLFTQQRLGRHGKPFVLVKLRTMAGPPGSGRAYRERHRITGYGRVIRHLRVDELPQILHLLTGEMSLVGPRPLVAEHLVEAGGGGRRQEVRPGFTCYAQLELAEHGFLDRYRQIRLDEEYVERIGFRTDVAILWRTAEVLVGPRRYRPPLARFEPEHAGAIPAHRKTDDGRDTDRRPEERDES